LEELLQEGVCQLLILSRDCRIQFGLEKKLENVRETNRGDNLIYRYLKDDSNINDMIAPRNRQNGEGCYKPMCSEKMVQVLGAGN
jgi:hypothetical protein